MPKSASKNNNLSHRKVSKFFDFEANYPLTLEDFNPFSTKEVSWKCNFGHKWKAKPFSLKDDYNCPFCAGKRSSPENNLSLHPVAKEFNYERNKPLRPEDFTLGSKKKIWWKCSKNPEHEWEAQIQPRVKRDIGCPHCRGTYPSKQNNLSLHSVAQEFHPTKNGDKKPEDFLPGTQNKIWWICEKGHEWEAQILNRVNGASCPLCSGHKPSKENNLSLHPVSKEFHYERNSPLKPENVLPFSNKKIWWKCDKGHEWESTIANRTGSRFTGCPHCSNQGSSQGEREILEFITSLGLNPIHRHKLDGVESDIFIPEKNLAIEHNGLYWHSSLFKDKKYHYTKYKHFRDRGMDLIQIWQDEWRCKHDIVKSIIQQKLGVSPIRIYARKCSFVEGDFSQFIEDNHISGNVRAQKYLGLEYQGELVAAMSLRKPFHKKWSSYTEIARFCTKKNTAVIGGLSKMLKRIEKPILTYADCRFGSGDSYETVGFKRDGHTGVSLEWTNGNQRFNRFKFKARNGKTQKEVASENSVVELWGPGNIRFIYDT